MANASSAQHGRAASMGLAHGMVVQELGWDEDVDETLRDDIMELIDDDLVEDYDEAVDAVLLWWRDSDGDVTDGLVDALPSLSPAGIIWLMTPRKKDAVDPADISEGATTAGLSLTKNVQVSTQWHAHRLVPPKAKTRK